MNELEVNYGVSSGRKFLSILVGSYSAIYGAYQLIIQVIDGLYETDFYLAIVAVVLGLIMVLSVTVWKPKSLFKMDSDSISINMPTIKSTYSAEWIVIKEVGIGISFFRFWETDGKDYNIDLGCLKYEDLKNVKSAVIEICESKNIPYKNV